MLESIAWGYLGLSLGVTAGYLAGVFIGRRNAMREAAEQADRLAYVRAGCPHDPRDPMDGSDGARWRVRKAGLGRVTATCLGCGRTWEYERDGAVLGELPAERLPVGWRNWWD